ncbi:MAG: hypothetical protein AAGG48_14750 [Planctomycetota bacterium]
MNWFSYDGCSFELHESESAARKHAESAMQEWADDADDGGWDELSTQVCYGRVTHAVRVFPIPVTERNQHLVPKGCVGLEDHRLMRTEATS